MGGRIKNHRDKGNVHLFNSYFVFFFLCLVCVFNACKKESHITKRMNLMLVQRELNPKVRELFVIVCNLRMSLSPDIVKV